MSDHASRDASPLRSDRNPLVTALPPHARLLTPAQVADALGVGTTKVYDLIGRGELKSRRLGRSRRVSVDALTEFIESLPT